MPSPKTSLKCRGKRAESAMPVLLALAMAKPCLSQCPVLQMGLPGLDSTLGYSIDATFLQHSFKVIPSDAGAGECVVNLTQNEHITHWYPYDNSTVGVWDQVDHVKFTDEESSNDVNPVVIDLTITFDEWAALYTSVDSLFGLFSAGGSANEYISMKFQSDTVLAASEEWREVYTSDLLEQSLLQPNVLFHRDVVALPAPWFLSGNWHNHWLPHFKHYGTHFMRSAAWGGYWRYWNFIETATLFAHASADVLAQAQVDFLHLLELHGGVSGHAQAAAEWYLQAGLSSLSCSPVPTSGCPTNQSNKAAFGEWAASVPQMPQVLRADYTLNSNLLPGRLSQTHKEATVAYIAWSGVDQLEKIMQFEQAKLLSWVNISHQIPGGTCVTDSCASCGVTGCPIKMASVVERNASIMLTTIQSALQDIKSSKPLATAPLRTALLPIRKIENWTQVANVTASTLFHLVDVICYTSKITICGCDPNCACGACKPSHHDQCKSECNGIGHDNRKVEFSIKMPAGLL